MNTIQISQWSYSKPLYEGIWPIHSSEVRIYYMECLTVKSRTIQILCQLDLGCSYCSPYKVMTRYFKSGDSWLFYGDKRHSGLFFIVGCCHFYILCQSGRINMSEKRILWNEITPRKVDISCQVNNSCCLHFFLSSPPLEMENRHFPPIIKTTQKCVVNASHGQTSFMWRLNRKKSWKNLSIRESMNPSPS